MYKKILIIILTTAFIYPIKQDLYDSIYNSDIKSVKIELKKNNLSKEEKLEYINLSKEIVKIRRKEVILRSIRLLKVQSGMGKIIQIYYRAFSLLTIAGLCLLSRERESGFPLFSLMAATWLSRGLMHYVEDDYIEERYKDALAIKHLLVKKEAA
jgi:hypothetical protein